MLKPLLNNVLLKPCKVEERLDSGLFVPQTSSTGRYQKATVMAVGPGKRGFSGHWEPVLVDVGDIVLFDSTAAEEVSNTDADGVKYVLCQEHHLVAKDDV